MTESWRNVQLAKKIAVDRNVQSAEVCGWQKCAVGKSVWLANCMVGGNMWLAKICGCQKCAVGI